MKHLTEIMRSGFFVFLLLSTFSQMTYGKTYYFSSSEGKDRYKTSTESKPWKSISKLNKIMDQLVPGDMILFKRGDIFDGELIITTSGNAANPIIFGAYGDGDPPVISGFTSVQSWTSLGDGIYRSNKLATGNSANMLVLDGAPYALGRYPNADEVHGGYLIMDLIDGTTVIDNDHAPGDWKGGQIVMRTRRWTLERRQINSLRQGKIKYSPATQYPPLAGYGYFIQNHVSTLDQYGEWMFNSKSRTVSVYFGSHGPGNTNVQVSSQDILISVNASHIVVQDLALEGANRYGVFSDGFALNDFKLQNCTIDYSGIDAILVSGYDHFQVINCKIRNSNSSAIKLHRNDPNATVKNCEILNTGVFPGMGGDGDGHYVALFSVNGGLTAENNRIINSGYNAIRFGQEDILIKNNFVDNFCLVMDDGSGIYTYDTHSATGYDRIVSGNIILNGVGEPYGTPGLTGAAHGIYIDNNSTGVIVEDNSVSQCSGRGIFLHQASQIILDGNTVFDNGYQLSVKIDQINNNTAIDVYDNFFIAKEVDQYVAHLSSGSDNFSQLGTFDNNYYARPYDDEMTISLEYFTSGAVVNRPMTLDEWQIHSGQDPNSSSSAVKLPYYTLNDNMIDNRIANSTFDGNISGVSCWSPLGNCNLTHENQALAVHGPGPLYVGFAAGSVEKDKDYLVRFKASADQENNIEVFFQQASDPWTKFTVSRAVKIGTTSQVQEFLITMPRTENASLRLAFDDQDNTYFLDDVEFAEVDASLADNDFLFIYNGSSTQELSNLDGPYVDVTGQSYSGSVTLEPFTSLVLIKPESSISQGKENEQPSLGLEDINSDISRNPEMEFQLFPNPTGESLQISFEGTAPELLTFSITDQMGRVLDTKQYPVILGLNQMQYNVSHLTPGFYNVILYSANIMNTKTFMVR